MTLLATLSHFFKQYSPSQTYYIAFSGGLDSHVLLHLCWQLKKTLPLNLQVIHIHHGLSPNADEWVQHCAQICAQYEFSFRVHHANLQLTSGESIEEAAREARYTIFKTYLPPQGILLTAHHEEDQAETFLLQLMRGAGPKGLAAMPIFKPFAQGFHARPLLHCAHATLKAYAHDHQLNWVEDESNHSTTFSRNFIRHELLPLLKKRWPSASETIARSARHCAETQTLLEQSSSQPLLQLAGSEPHTLSITKLQTLSASAQRLMLRMWITSQGYLLPNTKKLAVIQMQMLGAAQDREPCVTWYNVEIKRYRDDLYLLPIERSVLIKTNQPWSFTSPLYLNDRTQLQAKKTLGQGLCASIPSLEVRSRIKGEKVQLTKRKSQRLKHLFQEWGIPTWERDQLPLLFYAEKLIAYVRQGRMHILHPQDKVAADSWGWVISAEPYSLAE